MGKPLRVLVVEDSEDDALLLIRELQQGGYEPVFECVDTEETMMSAIANQTWDIIIADYVMPHFGGLEALRLLQKSGRDLPFIVVSGKISEEIAVEAMKAGAHDYMSKSNLKRFIPAVERELGEAKNRRQRRQAEKALQESEERLREAQKMAHLGNWVWDVKTGNVKWSEEVFRIFHLDPKEFTPKIDSILELSPWPEDHNHNKELIQKATNSHEIGTYEQRFLRPDKSIGYYYSTFQGKYDDGGNLTTIVGTVQDITERKKAQQIIEDARTCAEDIIATIREPLIVLDAGLKVISASQSFYQTFKVTPEETKGRFIYNLGNGQWDIPKLRELLEEILPQSNTFDDYEIEHNFETIGPKMMLFSARRLDAMEMILITIEDITERKKIEMKLKEANEQLIKFNDLKDEFVSIASHELRTPLSIISGAVKLLIDEIPGKIVSGQKEILDMAMRNLNRLARIVDALLNISKIESGKAELYRTDADICRLITETVGEYSQQAEKKHINLSCQLPGHPVILYADADRIKEVIANLLSNSIKFTPEGGSINVFCEDRNDDVFIFVKDTGRGVAKNDVSRMFEKFTQFNRKVGPGEKGTGLGLAICKGLVNLHNGKIWAESDTGSGMKISFTIPHLSVEDIFTESADNAVKSSLKTGGGAAVILISTKPIIQMDSPQMQTILKDISGVLELNLRRNILNTVIQGTKEVLVVLGNCDINGAATVCQRLTQAIEDHLADKDLSSKLDLLTGYAAYPDDGQTGQSLIEKAREAVVACLPSNKA